MTLQARTFQKTLFWGKLAKGGGGKIINITLKRLKSNFDDLLKSNIKVTYNSKKHQSNSKNNSDNETKKQDLLQKNILKKIKNF